MPARISALAGGIGWPVRGIPWALDRRDGAKGQGNSRLHFTNRVVVLANAKEIARWNFSSSNRPEGENFSREIKLNVEAEAEIVAEANCNLHGSGGPAKAMIKIEG